MFTWRRYHRPLSDIHLNTTRPPEYSPGQPSGVKLSSVAAMALLKLNLDIIAHILMFLDNNDLIQAACVSRSLHSIATKEVLLRGVTLAAEEQIQPFLDFLASDAPRRAQLVKTLNICVSVEDVMDEKTCASLIAEAMEHCSFVRHLRLEGLFFDIDEHIGQAFAALTHVEHLEVLTAGDVPELARFISAMQSKLVKARIDYNFYQGTVDGIPHNPNYALLPFTSTLEHLVLHSPSFELDGIVFPRVTTLQLSNFASDIRPLLRSFPNLRQLILLECYVEDPDHLRVENQLACSQEPWRQLDYLDASCNDAYDLGLTCHVRHWKTDSLLWNDDKSRVEACLRELKPSALSMPYQVHDETAFEHVALAMREVGLTHLCLDIRSWSLDQIDRFADAMITRLSALPLIYLEVRFHLQHPQVVRELRMVEILHSDGEASEDVLSQDPQVVDATTIYNAYREYGELATVSKLFSQITSLQYLVFRFRLVIGLSGAETLEQECWTVERGVERCVAVKMTSTCANEMIVKEGMQDILVDYS